MGSCASAQRKKTNSGSSSWKVRPSLVHFDSKPENVVGIISSHHHGYKSRVSPLNSVSSFSNYGSKEETFFDTQAWLESDCDDEFYSVKGDFTPSRGNTPLNRSIPGTPLDQNLSSQVNRALFEGRSPPYYAERVSAAAPRLDSGIVLTPNSPPTEKKKKTSKKLGDLFRESIRERQEEELLEYSKPEKEENKEKDMNQAQCCLPRLHSARFLKKTFAPPIAVDA